MHEKNKTKIWNSKNGVQEDEQCIKKWRPFNWNKNSSHKDICLVHTAARPQDFDCQQVNGKETGSDGDVVLEGNGES